MRVVEADEKLREGEIVIDTITLHLVGEREEEGLLELEDGEVVIKRG